MSDASNYSQPPSDEDSTVEWASAYRILVAEDNDINQELMLMLLEEIGLAAEVANNGREALAALKQNAETKPYDIVLMDCQMPEMDGFEATQRVRAGEAGSAVKDIIILAVTANALPGDRERCLNAGMNDYLSKPIDEKLLFDKLNQWLPKTASKADTSHGLSGSAALSLPATIKTIPTLPNMAKKPAVYVRILKLYLSQNTDFIQTLSRLFQQKDIDALRHHIHTIKGSSGNLGMKHLYDLAGEYEKQLRQGELISVVSFQSLISLVEDSFSDARSIVESHERLGVNEYEVNCPRRFTDITSEMIKKLECSEIIDQQLQKEFSFIAQSELTKGVISEISDYLNSYDYDEALEKLRESI